MGTCHQLLIYDKKCSSKIKPFWCRFKPGPKKHGNNSAITNNSMRPSCEKYFMSSKYCCLKKVFVLINRTYLFCVFPLYPMNVKISCMSSRIINIFDLSDSQVQKRQLAMKSFASLHLAPSSNLLHAASTTLRALNIVNIQSLATFLCQIQQNECQKLTAWQCWCRKW